MVFLQFCKTYHEQSKQENQYFYLVVQDGNDSLKHVFRQTGFSQP